MISFAFLNIKLKKSKMYKLMNFVLHFVFFHKYSKSAKLQQVLRSCGPGGYNHKVSSSVFQTSPLEMIVWLVHWYRFTSRHWYLLQDLDFILDNFFQLLCPMSDVILDKFEVINGLLIDKDLIQEMHTDRNDR